MSAQAAKGILRVSQNGSGKTLLAPSYQAWQTQSSKDSSDVATEGRKSKMTNLATMKKGTGYRSSFSGMVATVFGATGMVGRGVCSRLGKNGSQIIIPYRSDPYDSLRLKVCGDLGQVLFTRYDLRDEESIRKAMKYSEVVINLVGRNFETSNFKFKDVNTDGPARLARIAREMGVKRFIHISSINASENPERVFMPWASEWLKTKWHGENAVFEEFPDATIFRPTQMYGFPDHFVHYYNTWFRGGFIPTHIPLWKRGDECVKSPLWVSDLTSGIFAALDDPETKGQIIEAMGPEQYVLGDLMDWMHEVMHKDPVEYNYKRTDLRFDPICFYKAAVGSMIGKMGGKYFRSPTLEYLERTQLNEVSEGIYPTLADLGVRLHTIQEKMVWELELFRAFRFHTYISEQDRPVIHPIYPIDPVKAKALIETSSQSKYLLKAVGL